MQATKFHLVYEEGTLDESLGSLLRAYEKSIGGVGEGTPSELVQAAARIPARRVEVHEFWSG